jgi:hypothetical protein
MQFLDGFGCLCLFWLAVKLLASGPHAKAKRRFETVMVTCLILMLGFGATVTKEETLKGVTGKRSALNIAPFSQILLWKAY